MFQVAVPAVDVLQCVRQACEEHYVTFTIPWVVEFLSMMDPLASELHYYQLVFKQLVKTYR